MPHGPLLLHLALILAAAAMVASLFQRIRQPVVVGYILAGALLDHFSILSFTDTDRESIRAWADLGVVFVMFHLGLEFSLRRFQRIGFSTAMLGLFEIGAMIGVGLLAANALGYHGVNAIFLGAMVSISSTTIIVKAFDELGLRSRLFAERVTALLIVEDLVAVLILVVLGAMSSGRDFAGSEFIYLGAELVVVIGGWILIGGFIVPRFIRHVGQSERDEPLTLLAIGLCMAFAVAAEHFHYSMALGAFIMGSIINETREAARVERLIRPLRDVFSAVFFVSVGLLANFSSMQTHGKLVLSLVIVVLFGKFFALFLGSLATGQNIRASARVGASMGQIGEFSFIIASLGLASGRMAPELQPVIITVSIMTSFATPFLISASEPIGRVLEAVMPQPLKRGLDTYAERLSQIRDEQVIPHWLRPGLGRLLLNGLLVSLIFGAVRRFLQPMLFASISDQTLAQAAGLLLAIALSAPFLYAMLTAAQRRDTSESESPLEATARAILFLIVLLMWIAGLSTQFVSAWASAAVTLLLAILLAIISYRRLELSYSWLEGRFLAGLSPEPDDGESKTHRAMRELAPWHAHLVRFIVHPNSAVAGLTLQATGLRSRHGLIVICIRRGDRMLAPPSPTELILPGDELLTLGTDEEIDLARPEIEGPATRTDPSHDFADFELRSLRIRETSVLAVATIQSSRLREDFGVLIVGVERGARRILTPPPHFQLRAGDMLWVVGLRSSFRKLSEKQMEFEL